MRYYPLLSLCLCATLMPAAFAEGPIVTQPLSVEQAVALALDNRPELKAAAAEVRAQDATARVAHGQLAPQTSLSGFAVTQNTGMIYTTTPHISPTFYSALPAGNALDFDLTIMVPLTTGGRLQEQVASSLLAARVARATQYAQVLTIQKDTRKQFLATVLSMKTAAVFDTVVTQQTETVRLAQEQFRVGRLAHLGLDRAQAELASSQQMDNNAHNDVQQALSELKWTLGISQQSQVELEATLPAAVPVTDLAALITLALKQRPELAGAHLQVLQADHDVKLAQAAFRPEVYLNGMGQSTSGPGPSTTAGASVGLSASFPVTDGGQRRSQVSVAESTRARLQAMEEAASQSIERDVTKAWHTLGTQYANLSLTEPALASAEENYRVAGLRFQLGRGIQLELIDAILVLERAQVNQLQALYSYHEALADLDWSVGR